MKKLLASLLVVFFVASCSELYRLPTNVDVMYCEVSAFKGYILPDSQDPRKPSATGRLYIDQNQLNAEPMRVEIKRDKRDKALRLFGQNLEANIISLKPYVAPTQKAITKRSVSFQDSIYDCSVTTDVEYGKATGLWNSFIPDPEAEFVDIYTDKMKGYIIGSESEQTLLLDIYKPQDHNDLDTYPLLVMVHGGAFFTGDKQEEEYKVWCQKFANCGYLAVSVNYRMGWWPNKGSIERSVYRGVQDVRAAVCYMLSQKRFKIDPNRIYLAGCSAGAITALHTAFMTENDRPSSTKGSILRDEMGGLNSTAVVGRTVNDFTVDAICNMWGGILDNPGTGILKNTKTSILSIQSENDPIVPAHHNYPFKDITNSIQSVGKTLQTILRTDPTKVLMPKITGSWDLDSYLSKNQSKLNIRHTLVGSQVNKHTLVLDENNHLNSQHQEYFDLMTDFFSKGMVKHAVELKHSTPNSQAISNVDPSDVMQANWAVEGGVIKSITEDGAEIEILLFGDKEEKKVIYKGLYNSQIGFEEVMKF